MVNELLGDVDGRLDGCRQVGRGCLSNFEVVAAVVCLWWLLESEDVEVDFEGVDKLLQLDEGVDDRLGGCRRVDWSHKPRFKALAKVVCPWWLILLLGRVKGSGEALDEVLQVKIASVLGRVLYPQTRLTHMPIFIEFLSAIFS